MKKMIALVLSLVLCLSLCACGDNGDDTTSVNQKVKNSVIAQLTLKVKLQYEITGQPIITTNIKEISENRYKVTGKITVRDAYGDSYTGKYDAIVDYDPSKDNCKANIDLGDLYRD